MIRVSVEVSGGEAAHFRVEVRAPSIERAVRLATIRYPDCGIRLLFPIDPHAFFLPGEPRRAEEGLLIEKTEAVRDGAATNRTRRRPSKQRSRRKPRIDTNAFPDLPLTALTRCQNRGARLID